METLKTSSSRFQNFQKFWIYFLKLKMKINKQTYFLWHFSIFCENENRKCLNQIAPNRLLIPKIDYVILTGKHNMTRANYSSAGGVLIINER